ncbi:LuxR family transcriptional regulator [Pyxidicoccus fallax]|uniref:LuxR family transcriptional regulator n=1 Tax=Pyxidicoccus fallax TaxID=394095 RepID=A0A848LL09_9BACT|nr:LuxR C-terminal-related transcriptional regulator [Pyxidicoccus fallax]NMO18475.1 LuxR family transcriptional regulator [Pyxidicoccus fallax]NPC81686.1 LuxR family transcriptional regulator [Pyxidicoccus fallax]
MGLVKGAVLLHLKQFVHDRFGSETWQTHVAALPAADRAGALNPVPACWYDVDIFRHLLRVSSEYSGSGSRFVISEMGRYTAERELSGPQRWFLCLRPSFAVQNLDLCWRRLFDMGRWSSGRKGGELLLRLGEWPTEPPLCEWGAGYLRGALDLFGWQLDGVKHMDAFTQGEEGCAFVVGGRLKSDAVRLGRLTSRAEVIHAARVFTQYTQTEELARLVVELVRVQLGATGVQLWVLDEYGEREGMRLLCTSGEWERGKRRSCFLLDTSGRTVGRIEVCHMQPQLEEGAASLLDELLPFIADSLAGLQEERAPAPEVSRTRDEVFNHRLLAARNLWGLTARQTDVLALVVQGQANKEIAVALGCQKSTVELHMSHILRKCGAENRSMLTASFWGLHGA